MTRGKFLPAAFLFPIIATSAWAEITAPLHTEPETLGIAFDDSDDVMKKARQKVPMICSPASTPSLRKTTKPSRSFTAGNHERPH